MASSGLLISTHLSPHSGLSCEGTIPISPALEPASMCGVANTGVDSPTAAHCSAVALSFDSFDGAVVSAPGFGAPGPMGRRGVGWEGGPLCGVCGLGLGLSWASCEEKGYGARRMWRLDLPAFLLGTRWMIWNQWGGIVAAAL